MKVQIIRSDGMVAIDAEWRSVDLSDVDPEIRAVHADTAAGRCTIEYEDTATTAVEVRDVEAEDAAWADARSRGIPEHLIDVPVQKRMAPMRRPALSVPIADVTWLSEVIGQYRALDPTAEQLAERERQAQRAAKLAEISAIEHGQAGLRKLREILIAVLPDGKDKSDLSAAEAAIADKRRELDAI